jgi:hypothetical protein
VYWKPIVHEVGQRAQPSPAAAVGGLLEPVDDLLGAVGPPSTVVDDDRVAVADDGERGSGEVLGDGLGLSGGAPVAVRVGLGALVVPLHPLGVPDALRAGQFGPQQALRTRGGRADHLSDLAQTTVGPELVGDRAQLFELGHAQRLGRHHRVHLSLGVDGQVDAEHATDQQQEATPEDPDHGSAPYEPSSRGNPWDQWPGGRRSDTTAASAGAPAALQECGLQPAPRSGR